MGIPFDVIHGVSNFFITLFVFIPFYYIMKKLNNGYNTDSGKL